MLNPAKVHPSWVPFLNSQSTQRYFIQLQAFLQQEYASGKAIYPPEALIFKALEHTPLPRVKVVILGQDPYHGPHQAHGLSFSVAHGVPPPPSLLNIFKALEFDLQQPPPAHGDLTAWAEQGVLLLNTTLTVEAHRPNSHQNKGWETFTHALLVHLSQVQPHVVFMLWGASAQKKASVVQQPQHLILTAPHPSPLSAYRGFIACKHFSMANVWLLQQGLDGIDWELAPQPRLL